MSTTTENTPVTEPGFNSLELIDRGLLGHFSSIASHPKHLGCVPYLQTMQWCRSRGYTAETWQAFRFGYLDAGAQALDPVLEHRGVQSSDFVLAGLWAPRNRTPIEVRKANGTKEDLDIRSSSDTRQKLLGYRWVASDCISIPVFDPREGVVRTWINRRVHLPSKVRELTTDYAADEADLPIDSDGRKYQFLASPRTSRTAKGEEKVRHQHVFWCPRARQAYQDALPEVKRLSAARPASSTPARCSG